MEIIRNYEYYTDGMKRSIRDKLFFLGLIPNITSITDFGCGDGSLLRVVEDEFPNIKLTGVDNDPEMLDIANKTCRTDNFILSSSIPPAPPESIGSVLVLSSVIHEIYSYDDPLKFWNQVFNSGYDYISIRDMMVSRNVRGRMELNDVLKVRNNTTQSHLEQFEKIWGSIEERHNFIHYLLKSQFEDSPNWDREVRENYLPVTVEALINEIPLEKYRISYFNHFILPYTWEFTMKTKNIDIKDNTHVKILLHRVK